jgi:NAD(P)-dependent dehydrogenase (short-subunit alcohol dehydrogenase family)
MSNGKLEGRVALVTGGGGGIGGAICREFAAEGARVLCADIDQAAAVAVTGSIAEAGGEAAAQACDVSRGASAKAAVDAAVGRFGALHILVNCAAVFTREATLPELDEAEWQHALDVNVTGAFHMSRFAVPAMAAAGGGSIIHVASQMATVAHAGHTTYCMTKGALLMLAKGMALDHAAQGIRVNTLSPGGTATESMVEVWGSREAAEREWGKPKHPLGRLGTPEEMARAAVFLASDDSSFMTAADLVIDGGYTAW